VPHVHSRPKLWYDRRGSGEPLLWVTGFTISSAVFDPVLDLYDECFECITYDHRGSGRSGAPPWPTSLPELAADATRVLDEVGIESAHVYGLSMGGMVAQELALRFPERVRGLVLGGCTAGGPRAIRPTLGEWKALASGVISSFREKGRPWLAGAVFSEQFRRENPERARELIEFFRKHRAPPHGALAHLLASIYHDTVDRLDQVQSPTLVLHGDADAMTPLANARMLARRIPDAELRIVPGAGHAYLLEQPEHSRDLLFDWLDAREPIPAGARRTDLTAPIEPLTRPFGLQTGALRTGRSLVGWAADKLTGGGDERDDEEDAEGTGQAAAAADTVATDRASASAR
jgi:3-oxoadipate enol-lactonase